MRQPFLPVPGIQGSKNGCFCTFTLSINIANNWQGHTCAICLNVFSFCLTMKDNPVTIMGLRFLVGLFCFPSGERCSSLLGKSDFEGKILALPRKGGRILMMKIFADLTICKKMTLLFRPLESACEVFHLTPSKVPIEKTSWTLGNL